MNALWPDAESSRAGVPRAELSAIARKAVSGICG
jgi:hypothetical protein